MHSKTDYPKACAVSSTLNNLSHVAPLDNRRLLPHLPSVCIQNRYKHRHVQMSLYQSRWLEHTDPFTSLRLHFCELNQEHISSLQICSFGLLCLVQPNFGFKTLIMCVRCVASMCVRFISIRILGQVFWIPQASLSYDGEYGLKNGC